MAEIKSGCGRAKSFEYVAPEEKQMFSKGPWRWKKNYLGKTMSLDNSLGGSVLDCDSDDWDYDIVVTREKDAHLIAAAPDLYEALQRLVNVSAEIAPDVQSASVFADARAALAKSRGES